MKVTYPNPPTLSQAEQAWTGPRKPPNVDYVFSVADIARQQSVGNPSSRLPWEAPFRDAGEKGISFVPAGLNHHHRFWEEVVLRDHPQREHLTNFLRDGVSVFDFLLPRFRGPSRQTPYRADAFPGAVYPNRIPSSQAAFVQQEVRDLVHRGCLVKWTDVRGAAGPPRPRLILSISVEPQKPRMIINAIPLNDCCRHVPFSMDTVSKVAVIAEERVFMGSLDDRSGFHNLGLQPASWPLFGIHYDGVDHVCTTLPFGWNESPYCYHSLSEAKAAFLRSKGIPVLAYIDDAWYANFVDTFGASDDIQWKAAAEALHIGVLVSFLCGYFLSDKKCDLRPSQQQRYLGIICDSQSASFRVPQDKLDKLHTLITEALTTGFLTSRTLERIAGKCVSMSVAIRPASLWTHYMFAALKRASGTSIRLRDKPDLVAELSRWLQLSSTSQEGPWFKARHFKLTLTQGSSDASSTQYGGVVALPHGPFTVGGGFPADWIPRPINGKETFALLEVLSECCRVNPGALYRAQLLMDVDNSSTVTSFRKGRSSNPINHAMLVQLFELQVAHGFWLTLRWVPSATNRTADAITRPSIHEIVRLRPHAFRSLERFFGAFSVDLMASSDNAQHTVDPITSRPRRLPFFSRYHCEGSAGVDVFQQNVANTPGVGTPAFGYCFPPPLMVGHLIQHLAECHAHAVVVIPTLHEYWSPRVQRATVRQRDLPSADTFCYPHHRHGLRDYRYNRHGMRAVELDFRTVPIT